MCLRKPTSLDSQGVLPRRLRLNDSMGTYVVAQLIKTMTKKRIQVDSAKVLVMGLAFKENCPDLRNTGHASSRHHRGA